MRTSVHQVVMAVTPMPGVATSLARISASATRASMEMDTLVLVGKQCVYVCVNNAYMCQQHSSTQYFPDTSPSEFSLFPDIDECTLSNSRCEHNCTNEPGGYSCQCASGYQLNQDGHNCTGKTSLGALQWPIHFNSKHAFILETYTVIKEAIVSIFYIEHRSHDHWFKGSS